MVTWCSSPGCFVAGEKRALGGFLSDIWGKESTVTESQSLEKIERREEGC
jgi:hypothetical protein